MLSHYDVENIAVAQKLAELCFSPSDIWMRITKYKIRLLKPFFAWKKLHFLEFPAETLHN